MAVAFATPSQQQPPQQFFPGSVGVGSIGNGPPAQLRGFDASSVQQNAGGYGVGTSLGIGALAAAGATTKALRRRHRAHRRLRTGRCRLLAADAQLATSSADVEVVQPYVTACSTARKWEDAAEELSAAVGSGYEAGFAFISDIHLTMNGIAPVMELLRSRLGVQTLVGCACSGALGQPCGLEAQVAESAAPMEVEKGPVISVGLFRKAGATPFFLGGAGQGDEQLLARKQQEGDTRAILMISDPFAPVEEIMSSLDSRFPNAVKAGGVSAPLQVGSEERLTYAASIAIASEGCDVRLHNQGLVGLLLSEVDVHTVVCQGCRAVGPAIKVTQVNGAVCQGIGGRPAQESLRLIFSSVDPATQAKMQENLTVGLGRVGQSELSVGDGDWLIRGISGVTPDGGLVVGSGVQEGQPFRFHVRDRESAESDLGLMLKRYRLERAFRGGAAEPMGCFLFTCNGRGQAVYGRDNVDSRAAFEALGGSMNRVAGFFCNGELGAPGLVIPDTEGNESMDTTAIHGFTAVFAMLLPRSKA